MKNSLVRNIDIDYVLIQEAKLKIKGTCTLKIFQVFF